MTKSKNLSQILHAIVLSATLMGGAQADVEFELDGMRHRNETSSGALSKVSMAGGLEFFIDGKGFDDMPIINSVQFLPTQNAEGAIPMAGPPLNIDDQIQSATVLGRLAYTMPSVEDATGRTYDALSTFYIANSDTNLRFRVSVANTAEATDSVCPDDALGKCEVAYNWLYTPYLHDVSPNQVYWDQDINIMVNSMKVHDKSVTPLDHDPVVHIKMSGTRTDSEGYLDQSVRLGQWAIDGLLTRNGDQLPGKQIPEVRFRTGNAYLRPSAKHCNFAGDDCWYVKTHPKIDSISSDTGYLTGGQTLTINGWGLKAASTDDVEVTVDGVACKVTSTQLESITCETGAAAGVSFEGSQPGSPGLLSSVIEPTGSTEPNWKWRDHSTIDAQYIHPKLLTNWEDNFNNYTSAVTHTQGWFKAPATGKYRFYMACNDNCKFWLDNTAKFNKDAAAVSTMTEIMYRYDKSNGWRRYQLDPNNADYNNISRNKYVSDWIDLVEGEYHEIESYALMYWDTNYFTASVEFEAADTTTHHQSQKEIQKLEINNEQTFEEFDITVANPHGGKFKMVFFNPFYDETLKNGNNSIRSWSSDDITDTWDGWRMCWRIQWYFNQFHGGARCTSTLKYTDDAGTEVPKADATKYVYNVKMNKLINGKSFINWNVLQSGESSKVTVGDFIAESSAPISGKFQISCPNAGGDNFDSREFNYNHWTEGIQYDIHHDIPHLAQKTVVYNTGKCNYRENCVSMYIHFIDFNGDVPQCTIKSATDTPIEGGTNLTYDSTTEQEWGKNLMFEPIPMEMLYTPATKPQVLVKINGIEGVCPDFNCDYVYTQPTSEVTAQVLANGNELTITGTALPTTDVRVVLGNAECGTVTASETEITCTLNVLPAAGSWDVQVYDNLGLAPIAVGTAKIDVALVITSITPNTDLNQLGGDIITISGTGFDKNTKNTSVKFVEDLTDCDVESGSPTEVKCKVRGFDPATIAAAGSVPTYTVRVSVNAVEVATETVTRLTTKQVGQTVVPNSVSPVLSNDLVVTLEATYPGAMNSVDDFVVYLEGTSAEGEVRRPLFVSAVDAAAKTITIKFPGADSGIYKLAIEGTGVGRIDKDPLVLTVEGVVTNITPLQGSYLGGNKVTITGKNFSDNKLDNPVKVGNNWCYVETTSATEIVCRVGETGETVESSAVVLAFLRTSEEAALADGVSKVWEFVPPVATVTALTAAFDEATNTQVLTLSGTAMGTTPEDIDLRVDGVRATSLTATDTEATFTLAGLNKESGNKVEIFFPDGFPTGYDTVNTVAVTPNLVSISPAAGSAGGTLLTVTGTGFGANSEGVTLVKASDSSDVCDKVTITGYGSFTCMTKAEEILSTDTLKLKTSSGNYDCANTLVAADCGYEQTTAASPAVTGATVASSSTITITGTGFDTALDAVVVFKGVESDSAVITDATSITATFTAGVPVTSAASTISVSFVPKPAGGRRMLSLADSNSQLVAAQATPVEIENTLSVTASTTGLSCSFQGGCPYEVTAAGLYATLKESSTDSIDVCGNVCAIDDEASTADTVSCTLPLLASAYSASNYEVVSEDVLHSGTWTGTASDEELAKLVNGKNIIDVIDSTSSDCYFQIQYKENHVGVLDEVKFFINKLTNKTPFSGGNLIFQGSDDGTTFTDLWTVDASVHEGWNSKDFEAGSEPSYNIYRFQGKVAGSCRIGEVKLHGVESIDDDQSTYACTPKLMVDGAATDLSPVTYDAAKTPVLTSMSSRFGSVLGGESITFTGTGFDDAATTTVLIDDRSCSVTAQSTTEITCTTADKPYRPDTPRLVIYQEGKGYVATKGKTFLYISRWSDSQTWGGDLAPREGEAVSIPKGLHLLFDIDASPKLSFVNVEGSLLFPSDNDPTHHRTFDAHYILVKGGYMEVGTEENRYTSKITITMWSTKYDPNLPIFGNKVIGVNYGSLDMHGIERKHTWTELDTTVEIGGTSITLTDRTGKDELDWQVGEDIVIAPTSFSGRDAEQRTIASITDRATKPVITFTEPLLNQHYAGIQTFGAGTPKEDSIEMRAEVGLLTRNVVFRGDPEHSPDNQYGAVIICHSPGDETTQCRIDSVELTMVGQAFILGSYPIHFHMIGTVHKSYVRNNAIHHSFNRAVTIHGVHYLRVQNNVAYHTMGHTIFIEDAVESKNLIEDNLILDVRRSWSLLNTDQTPASIWITNPDNIIRRNHAGGSDRYSYWYDLQVTAIGPSFDANVCPENQKLGEFTDNVAHSNGRYGLRIFHNHIPRENQCAPINYDNTSASYNPPIIAEYKNLVAWKNKRNGAIIERAGAIHWINFKLADNLEVGMEMSRVDDNKQDGWAKIIGGLVIGKSENTEEALDKASPVGVRTPRTEYFNMSGVKFYNYNWNKAAGMHTCSHCWHDNNTDSGARHVTVEDLYFDTDSVQKIVEYTTPFRTIFLDKTGTMTGKGENSWFVPYFKHLIQPECTNENDTKGGITCDNTIQVRRIALGGHPSNLQAMTLKITQFEVADENAMVDAGTLKAYLDDQSNYGIVPYKQKKDPDGWAMPYVTGHRYRLHWGSGLDFDKLTVEPSIMWTETDLDVRMVFNFTETREAWNITTNYGRGDLIANKSMVDIAEADWQTGDMVMRNDTNNGANDKELEFVVNGKNPTRQNLQVRGYECILGKCVLPGVETAEIEGTPRPWSEASSWGGTLPVDGDEVEIKPTWWVELDLAETPKLASLQINGRLTFKNDPTNLPNIKLRSHHIFVRAGEFIIGAEDAPYEGKAEVELLGLTDSDTLTLSGTVKGGNKILASTNMVKFYGQSRDQMARLLETVEEGATTIKVDSTLDWAVGDELFIASSTVQHDYGEFRKITAVDAGVVTLDKALWNYHYGAAESTGPLYNGVDVRTEVLMLTRNIKVYGEDADGWGGQIMATDLMEGDGTMREGYLIMDNVQVYNCSQKDTFKSAIRFDGAYGSSKTSSSITNCAVHNGLDWGLSILGSRNIKVHNSHFVGWRAVGVRIDTATNITFTDNFVGDVRRRVLNVLGMFIDKEACIAYGSYEENGSGTVTRDMTFTGNTAAGCPFAGIIGPGDDCDDVDPVAFKNNIAHSVDGYGIYAYPNPASTTASNCFSFGYATAYKTVQASIFAMPATKLLKAHHLTALDSQKGISLNTGGAERDDVEIILSDSFFFGETAANDCPSIEEGKCVCQQKFTFMNGQNMNDMKSLMPTGASELPLYKSHGEGNWGGKMTINDCTFSKFQGLSGCGEKSTLLASNPGSSDKIPPHFFNNCILEDVDDNGFAFLVKPNPGWANVKDCGNFPCTAPNNLIFSFAGTTWKGTTPTSTPETFVVIPNEKTVGGTYESCVERPDQQAYICEMDNIGMMMFENLDDDAWDRAIQPVFLLNEATGFNNTLNAMMDHIWDTFYTGQRRMARFPTALATGQDYVLEFSGTPPKKIRFDLQARTGGTMIHIPYPVAGSIRVKKDGKTVDPNGWDEEIGKPAALSKVEGGCGENRFVGVENYLEFWLEPGCVLNIEPKDSIMAKVRMDWTLAEFYSDGGTTRFVDRLAASLGIASHRVKVVAIYEGSTVVDFEIEKEEPEPVATEDENGDPISAEDQAAALAAAQAKALESLASIKTLMVTQATTGNLDIGAPVMGLEEVQTDPEVKPTLLAGEPIPEPPCERTNTCPIVAPEGAMMNAVSLWVALLALAMTLM